MNIELIMPMENLALHLYLVKNKSERRKKK